MGDPKFVNFFYATAFLFKKKNNNKRKLGFYKKKEMEQTGFIIIGVLGAILLILFIGFFLVNMSSPTNPYRPLSDTPP